MDIAKLGLVNFLGVVAPGMLSILGTFIGIVGFLEYFDVQVDSPVLNALSNNEFLITIVLLLASALFGAAIRLFANDATEICSGFYLRTFRRNDSEYATERFPYPFVAAKIGRTVNPDIPDLLRKLNPDFDKPGNKDFYNYCKMQIRADSQSHAEDVERIEAYVRFLAGGFIACTYSFCICAVLVALFTTVGRLDCIIPLSGIAFPLLVVIIAILERFRHQHSREVRHTWFAFYNCEKRRAPIGNVAQ